MTFGEAIREAIHTGSDPAAWVTMQLGQYRRCTDHCQHDLANGVLVSDLLATPYKDGPHALHGPHPQR